MKEAVVYLLKKFAHDSDEEAKALLVSLGEKLEDAAPEGEVITGVEHGA